MSLEFYLSTYGTKRVYVLPVFVYILEYPPKAINGFGGIALAISANLIPCPILLKKWANLT